MISFDPIEKFYKENKKDKKVYSRNCFQRTRTIYFTNPYFFLKNH